MEPVWPIRVRTAQRILKHVRTKKGLRSFSPWEIRRLNGLVGHLETQLASGRSTLADEERALYKAIAKAWPTSDAAARGGQPKVAKVDRLGTTLTAERPLAAAIDAITPLLLSKTEALAHEPRWISTVSNHRNELLRLYFTDGDFIRPDLQRVALGRLLWATSMVGDFFLDPPKSFLSRWWALLIELDRLGAPSYEGDSPVLFAQSELNELANLLSLAQELNALRRLIRTGNDVAFLSQGGSDHRNTIDELDALASYVRQIIRTRLPRTLSYVDGLPVGAVLESEEVESDLAMAALSLGVAVRAYAVYVDDAVARLKRVSSRLQAIQRAPLDFPDGELYFPESAAWQRYASELGRLRRRIRGYVSSTEKKPFVVLVVGRPGTGKSYISELIRAEAGNTGRLAFANLAEASDTASTLRGIWNELHANRKAGINVAVLEEFDSVVGESVSQYRLALQPLWDGTTSGIAASTPSAEPLRLGRFVAVCLMSKFSTLEETARALASADKGADFLSRVDVVVEVPGFDAPESQFDLSLVAISRRAPDVHVSELALWLIGSVDATHNFRTVTKTLKTASSDRIVTSDLNIEVPQADRFWEALAEYGRLSSDRIRHLQESEQAGSAPVAHVKTAKVGDRVVVSLKLPKKSLDRLCVGRMPPTPNLKAASGRRVLTTRKAKHRSS